MDIYENVDTTESSMDAELQKEVHQLHAGICGGLADPNRILILYTLSERPHYVGELAEVMGKPQPTISRHLRLLKEKNLVVSQRRGSAVLYDLADERIIEALNILRTVLAERLAAKGELGRSVNFPNEKP